MMTSARGFIWIVSTFASILGALPARADDSNGRRAAAPVVSHADALPKVPALDLAGRVTDQTHIPAARENEEEYKAYCLALLYAHTTPAKAFANQARRDLTYAHLFEEPEKYRGAVVHFDGRLKRLRRFDADAEIRGTYDIPYVYEGWVFDPDLYGANPMCLLFTDLPPGIEVREKMDRRIGFDGYFFKKYRYKAGDGWHDCPLLIGHGPNVVAPPAPAQASFAHALFGGFLATLAVTVGLAVALAWWYRHGDARVRSLVAAANPVGFALPEDRKDEG